MNAVEARRVFLCSWEKFDISEDTEASNTKIGEKKEDTVVSVRTKSQVTQSSHSAWKSAWKFLLTLWTKEAYQKEESDGIYTDTS